jgi:Domain of unknown function (DUF5658)
MLGEGIAPSLTFDNMSLAWSANPSGARDYQAAQLRAAAPPQRIPTVLVSIEVFFYLQALDFLTTLIGLKMGIAEASPFIRSLLHFGPGIAVAASKIVALMLAAFCIKLNRSHMLRYVNYWYAAVVIWNLLNILVV